LSRQVTQATSQTTLYLKNNVRERLRRTGQYSIPYFVLWHRRDVERVIQQLGDGLEAGWVLKPAFGTASDCVSPKLKCAQDLDKAYQLFRQARKAHRKIHWSGDSRNWARACMLEPYLLGDEYTIEGTVDGFGTICIVGICEKEFGRRTI